MAGFGNGRPSDSPLTRVHGADGASSRPPHCVLPPLCALPAACRPRARAPHSRLPGRPQAPPRSSSPSRVPVCTAARTAARPPRARTHVSSPDSLPVPGGWRACCPLRCCPSLVSHPEPSLPAARAHRHLQTDSQITCLGRRANGRVRAREHVRGAVRGNGAERDRSKSGRAWPRPEVAGPRRPRGRGSCSSSYHSPLKGDRRHREGTAGALRLTLSPSKSRCARKMAASLMGTSSFLYRIWKVRLCTVLSWTQAECRLLPSAEREPGGSP